MQAKKFSKQCFFDFQVKKKGNSVIIEGFSNANTVDRMKERIDPSGWDLSNYEKNSVILFDHGHDPAFGFLPVGKALVTEKQESGLYTKVQLSNSQTEKISAVRDLVQEGILKTFSVGFDPKEDTKDGDTLLITKAELIEQSIVPIPMNQDSVFSLLSKRLKKTVCPSAKRWFQNWMGKIELVQKGAFTAALLHQRIADLEEMGNFDRGASLEHVAKLAGVNMKAIKDILAGEITPVPDTVLAAFAEVLRLNPSFLKDLDKSDVALIERARKISIDEGKGMTDIKTKTGEASGKKAAEFVVHQVIVPKEIFDEQEVAASFLEDAGYDASQVSETEDSWVFDQSSAEGLDLDKAQMFDLGDGVMAHVAPSVSKMSEGMSEDEGLKEGEEGDDTEEEKTDTEEEKTDDTEEEKTDDTDEEKGEDTEEEKTDDAKEKAAIDTTPPPDQNPLIELQKQQVTMLGALIEEVKKLTAAMTGQVEKPEPDMQEEGKGMSEEDDGEEEKAMVLRIREAHSAVKTGLKRLGV